MDDIRKIAIEETKEYAKRLIGYCDDLLNGEWESDASMKWEITYHDFIEVSWKAVDKYHKPEFKKYASEKKFMTWKERLLSDIFETSEVVVYENFDEVYEKIMKVLDDKSQKVIELYYQKQLSLEDIGREFNLTGSRIGQIREKALRIMRHPNRARLFSEKEYLVEEENALRERIEKKRKKLQWITSITNLIDEIEFQDDKNIFDFDLSNTTLRSLKRVGIYSTDDLYKLNFNLALERLGNALSDEDYVKMLAERDSKDRRELSEISIDELDLSIRGFNCLKRAGINTLQDLSDRIEYDDLLKVRNLGRKSYEEVKWKFYEFIADMGR